MNRERDAERLFSENVDRLVSGEEVKTGSGAGEDERTALEFARRMAALRAAPAAPFQANLKAKLLRQLNEQEAAAPASKPGWLSRLWPRQLVWQAVYAAAFILVVGGVLWSTGVFRSGPAPASPSTTAVFLQAAGSTNKSSYQPGEEVRIEVSLTNVASETLVIEQYPPVLSLMRTDTRQPVYTFGAGSAARTLAPGQVARFVAAWDQRDDRGRYVPGGNYYLELENLDLQGRGIRLDFSQPVSFDIRPTQS